MMNTRPDELQVRQTPNHSFAKRQISSFNKHQLQGQPMECKSVLSCRRGDLQAFHDDLLLGLVKGPGVQLRFRFGIQGLGLIIYGLGPRVRGLKFRVWS